MSRAMLLKILVQGHILSVSGFQGPGTLTIKRIGLILSSARFVIIGPMDPTQLCACSLAPLSGK